MRKSFCPIVISFFLWFQNVDAYDCKKSKEHQVELVFVQETSAWYAEFFRNLQRKYMNQLTSSLSSTYPKIRFGLTTFTSWSELSKHPAEFCYRFTLPLTNDYKAFVQGLNVVTISQSHNAEFKNSLMASSLSVTETAMGWSNAEKTAEGKRIVRIVVLITTEQTLRRGSMPGLPRFTGTSSDSCNNDAPDPPLVGQVFREHDVFFVVLIGQPWTGSIEDQWNETVRAMGVQPFLLTLDRVRAGDLLTKLREVIPKVLCLPRTTSTTSTTSTTTRAANTPGLGGPAISTSSTGRFTATAADLEYGIDGSVLVGAAAGGIGLIAVGCGSACFCVHGRRQARQEARREARGKYAMQYGAGF